MVSLSFAKYCNNSSLKRASSNFFAAFRDIRNNLVTNRAALELQRKAFNW